MGQGVDPVWENDMRDAGSSQVNAETLICLKKGSARVGSSSPALSEEREHTGGELQTCFDCTPT